MFWRSKSEGLYEKLYRQQKLYVKTLELAVRANWIVIKRLLLLCKEQNVDISKLNDKIKNLQELDQLLLDRELEKWANEG